MGIQRFVAILIIGTSSSSCSLDHEIVDDEPKEPIGTAVAQVGQACGAIEELLPYASAGTLEICEKPTVCEKQWESYRDCAATSSDIEQCRTSFELAQECTVCEETVVDPEGHDRVAIVNAAWCQATSRSSVDRYCSISDALVSAMGSQEEGLSTKIMVCRGRYPESFEQDVGYPEKGKITIQSVTLHGAEMVGSTKPPMNEVAVVQHEYRGNLVRHSETFFNWPSNAFDAITMQGSFQAPGGIGGQRIHVTKTPDDVYIASPLEANQPSGRYTFSVHIVPTVDSRRFRISIVDLVAASGLDDFTRGERFFDFTLGGSACERDFLRADETGVEYVGNGWYRAWVSTDFRAGPVQRPNLIEARIYPRDDDGGVISTTGAKAYVAGAQLERLPIGRYRQGAGVYVPTAGATSEVVLAHNRSMIEVPWSHNWGVDATEFFSSVDNGTTPVAVLSAFAQTTPFAFRRELVAYDGKMLRQELHLNDMRSGSFWLDDGIDYQTSPVGASNPSQASSCSPGGSYPCRLLIHVDNVEPAKIEVGERVAVLRVTKGRNWTVRGLRFAHGVGGPHGPAVFFVNTDNVEFTDNLVEHNNTGVNLSSFGEVLSARNEIRENSLFGQRIAYSGTMIGEQVTLNNWRGHRGHWRGGTVGGTKYTGVGLQVLDGNYSNNWGHGLWFDFGNEDIDVIGGVFSDNYESGIYYEANPSPTGIRISGIESRRNGDGIRIVDSRYVEVSDSIFDSNQGNIYMQSRLTTDSHDDTLNNVTLTDNVLTSCEFGRHYRYSDNDPSGLLQADWLATLKSNCNSFSDPGHGFSIKERANPPGPLQDASLSDWTLTTGEDALAGPCP